MGLRSRVHSQEYNEMRRTRDAAGARRACLSMSTFLEDAAVRANS